MAIGPRLVQCGAQLLRGGIVYQVEQSRPSSRHVYGGEIRILPLVLMQESTTLGEK